VKNISGGTDGETWLNTSTNKVLDPINAKAYNEKYEKIGN